DEHRIRGKAVLPAAAYLEIAFTAAKEIYGDRLLALEEIVFKEALIVPDDEALTLQWTLSPERPGTASFKFCSVDGGAGINRLHASGIVRIAGGEEIGSFAADDLIRQSQVRCPEYRSGVEHYRAMQERGLDYGPGFQGVAELWRRDGEAIARLSLPRDIAVDGQITAPVVDACFQALEAALPEPADSFGGYDCFVPVGLEEFRIYRWPELRGNNELWCRACLRQNSPGSTGQLEGDVLVLDENGQPVFEATGLRVKRVEAGVRETPGDLLGNWFYEVQWQAKAQSRSGEAEVSARHDEPGAWLIFADRDGLGEGLAARLEDRGDTCLIVFTEQVESIAGAGQDKRRRYWARPGDAAAIRRVIDEAVSSKNGDLKGIVHLWSLELPSAARTSLSTLELSETLA